MRKRPLNSEPRQFLVQGDLEFVDVGFRRAIPGQFRVHSEPAHLVEIPRRFSSVAERHRAADDRAGLGDLIDFQRDFSKRARRRIERIRRQNFLGSGGCEDRRGGLGRVLRSKLQIVDEKTRLHIGEAHVELIREAALHVGELLPLGDPTDDLLFLFFGQLHVVWFIIIPAHKSKRKFDSGCRRNSAVEFVGEGAPAFHPPRKTAPEPPRCAGWESPEGGRSALFGKSALPMQLGNHARTILYALRMKKVAARFLTTALGVMMLVAVQPGSSAAETTRVAMGVFRGNPNDFEESSALEMLGDRVLAELTPARGYDWMERARIAAARAEVGMSRSGFVSAGTEVVVGRWLRVDLLVLGTVRKAVSGERALRLQVVEINRADVLAEGTVTMPGEAATWATGPLAGAVAERIREKLDAGQKRRLALENRQRVAVPFFYNERAGRLDFFAKKLRAACAGAGEVSEDFRVLTFPAAATSREEDDLALAGLAEPSPAMLGVEIADAWVWGSFGEMESAGVPFPEVRVRVDLNVWRDGRLRRFGVEGVAGNLDALAREVAERAFALARGNAGEAEPFTREAMSRKLYAVADEWIPATKDRTVFEVPELRAKQRNLLRVLELAAFFDPTDPRPARELVIETWREHPLDTIVEFVQHSGESAAWGRFVERFGFAYDPPPRGGRDFDTRLFHSELVRAYLRTEALTIGDLGSWISRSSQRNTGSPSLAQLREWMEEHRREFFHRLENVQQAFPKGHAGGIEVIEALEWPGSFADAAQRLRCLELTGKLLAGHPPHEDEKMKLGTLAKQILADAGDARSASDLLGFAIPLPPPVSNQPPAKVQQGKMPVPGEAEPPGLKLPPLLKVEWKPIKLPGVWRDEVVSALHWDGSVLWIGLGGDSSFRGPKLSLWKCADGRLARVGFIPEEFAYIPAIQSDRKGRVWVLTSNGVWSNNEADGKLTRHTLQEGVADPSGECAVLDGETMWVGGGRVDDARLSSYNTVRATWAEYPVNVQTPQPGVLPGKIERLAVSQGMVFVHGIGKGYTPYTACLDPKTNTWQPLDELLFPKSLDRRRNGVDATRVIAIVGNAGGFWIGTPGAFFHLDPRTRQLTDLRLPVSEANGGVSAICEDGDYLWVKADISNRANDTHGVMGSARYLFVFHQPTRKWVGVITMHETDYTETMQVSHDCIWFSSGKSNDARIFEAQRPGLPPIE